MNEIELKLAEVQLGVLRLQHKLLESRVKGDAPGHPFRGNQFSGGGGGAVNRYGEPMSVSPRAKPDGEQPATPPSRQPVVTTGKPTSLSTTDSLVRSLGYSGQQSPQGNKQRVNGDYFETAKRFRKAGWKEEGTDWGKDSIGTPIRTDKYSKGKYRARATSQASGGVHTDIEFFED